MCSGSQCFGSTGKSGSVDIEPHESVNDLARLWFFIPWCDSNSEHQKTHSRYVQKGIFRFGGEYFLDIRQAYIIHWYARCTLIWPWFYSLVLVVGDKVKLELMVITCIVQTQHGWSWCHSLQHSESATDLLQRYTIASELMMGGMTYYHNVGSIFQWSTACWGHARLARRFNNVHDDFLDVQHTSSLKFTLLWFE